MVQNSPMQLHHSKILHNGANQTKREKPFRLPSHPTDWKKPKKNTSLDSLGSSRTQVSWHNTWPRTQMESVCQLHTHQRHKVGYSVLLTSQKHERSISQIHEKILHYNCHSPHVICHWPLPHSTVQTSQWVKGTHKEIGESTMTSGPSCNRGPQNNPMDSLDAHANLLPFQHLIENLLHQAATCITTLPKTHLLAAHANKAAKKYAKSHRSLLHEPLHAYRIIPNDFEDISQSKPAPNKHPNTQSKSQPVGIQH